jgi:hypothetical protein
MTICFQIMKLRTFSSYSTSLRKSSSTRTFSDRLLVHLPTDTTSSSSDMLYERWRHCGIAALSLTSCLTKQIDFTRKSTFHGLECIDTVKSVFSGISEQWMHFDTYKPAHLWTYTTSDASVSQNIWKLCGRLVAQGMINIELKLLQQLGVCMH